MARRRYSREEMAMKKESHRRWNAETLRVDGFLGGIKAQLSPAERRWLWEAAKNVKPGGVWVDIGTKWGGSAAIAARANPDMTVYTLDIHNDKKWRWDGRKGAVGIREQFDGLDNIEVLTGESHKMIPFIAGKQGRAWAEFDGVFVDGDHTYEGVVADIKAFAPHVVDGGLLCGHDYFRPDTYYLGQFHEGLRRGVNEALSDRGYRPRLYERIWYIVVQK